MAGYRIFVIFAYMVSATIGMPMSVTDIYENEASLSTDLYYMCWEINTTYIIIEVHAKTTGWVGFGLSPNGGMRGSDVVIGWVKDGQTFFQDRHAEGEFEPLIDKQQDWILFEGAEEDGYTKLKFGRTLTACDEEQDYPITIDGVYVIWSIGAEDPVSVTGLTEHTHKGAKTIHFIDPPMPEIADTPDMKYFDFSSLNYSVPHDEEGWLRTYFELPKLNEKHHAIRFDPIIHPGNVDIIHHMLLYSCHKPVINGTRTHHVIRTNSTREDVYMSEPCTTQMTVWGPGAGPLTMPEDVGFEIGTETSTYFAIEVHITNPTGIVGRFDSSGMRMAYTNKLRKYDAGNLELFNEIGPAMVVPPGEKKFVVRAQCNPSCLSDSLGEETINIFGAFMHMHFLGRGIVVHLERDGRMVEPLLKDERYNTYYQTVRPLRHFRQIKAGDLLSVECRYDSTNRTKPVMGGLESWEEMCGVLIYYYPKIDLQRCGSTPTYNVKLDEVIEEANKIRTTYDWADNDVKVEFEKLVTTSEQRYHCSNATHVYRTGKMPAPSFPHPYTYPVSKVCEVSASAQITSQNMFLLLALAFAALKSFV